MTRSHLRLLAILVPLLTPACASTDKGEATGESVTTAADQIGQGITQLDATLAALKSLVETPAPDLKGQFETYTKSLSQLESTAEDVADLAAKIDTKSAEYFAQWDEQIAAVQNEDIRERTTERRQAISAGFAKIQKEYGEAREEFKPLLSDLRDIRTALTADLTLDGIKLIADTAEDVEDEGKDVKESLQELETKFRDLGVKLSRSGPPKEAPKK